MMCDRCDELQERIIQLEHELYAHDYMAPAALRLSITQNRILGLLLRHDRTVTHDVIFEATRGLPRARAVVRGEKLIPTMMCKLRQKLAPHGMTIESDWGGGYRLQPETRARLLAWDAKAAA